MSEKKKIEIRPLSRAFGFVPNSLQDDNRTVDMVWTTGERVLRNDFFDGPFYEELEVSDQAIRLERLNNGAPLLNTHQQDDLNKVMGSMIRAWIKDGQGLGTVKFSRRPDVEPYYQDVKDGNLRNVSVGYRVYNFAKVGEENGIPVFRAVDWEPYEVSLVPIGADSLAGVRSAAETTNSCVLESELKRGETMEKEVTEAQAAPVEEVKEIAAEPAAEEKQAEAQPEAKEHEGKERAIAEIATRNILEILEVTRKAKLETSVAENFIKSGKSLDQVRKEIIDMIATKETVVPNIEIGRTEEETHKRAIENALHHRINPKATLEEGREYRGLTVLELAREMLGPKARGMTPLQVARSVLTSSNFPILMENIAQKEIIDAYKVAPSTYEIWTKKGTIVDFKQASRLMNSGAPDLVSYAEGATLSEGSMADSRREYNQLSQYGKNVVLSTQAIINNDLHTFDDLIRQFGLAAKRKEAALVYTSTLIGNPNMADTHPLFDAVNHGNAVATGTALSTASLNAGFQAMKAQLTVDALDYADIMPKFLIVGLANEATAKQILTNIQAQQVSNVNIYSGSLDLVVDPRVTGTNWFLAADPALNPLIEVAHLAGQEGPMVVQDTLPSVDGIYYSCRHYVGVKALDWRSGYYNPGA